LNGDRMKQKHDKRVKLNKGFTLIEMLVVIAIVAILVAVVVPLVLSSTQKAKAATDAANLRSILALTNGITNEADYRMALSGVSDAQVVCKSFPKANMYVAYDYPAFIKVIFVEGVPGSTDAKYYIMEYFSDVALNGESSQSTGKPLFEDGVVPTWYNVSANKEKP